MLQAERRLSSELSSTDSAGIVRPDEMYTLHELKRRLGMSDSALRAARRKGLRVFYVHKRGFIFGKDLIDYILHSDGRQDA